MSNLNEALIFISLGEARSQNTATGNSGNPRDLATLPFSLGSTTQKKNHWTLFFPLLHGTQLSFTPLTGFITPELALKMSIITKNQPYLTLSFHDITNQKKHTRFCCKLMPCCLNSLMDLRNDNDFSLSNNHH